MFDVVMTIALGGADECTYDGIVAASVFIFSCVHSSPSSVGLPRVMSKHVGDEIPFKCRRHAKNLTYSQNLAFMFDMQFLSSHRSRYVA